MGTIHCACGQSFSDGEIPCKFENHLIPDTSVEHLTRLVIDAVTAGTDLDLEVGYLITSHGATTYECPYCRRLIVFWDGIDKPARSYPGLFMNAAAVLPRVAEVGSGRLAAR